MNMYLAIFALGLYGFTRGLIEAYKFNRQDYWMIPNGGTYHAWRHVETASVLLFAYFFSGTVLEALAIWFIGWFLYSRAYALVAVGKLYRQKQGYTLPGIKFDIPIWADSIAVAAAALILIFKSKLFGM